MVKKSFEIKSLQKNLSVDEPDHLTNVSSDGEKPFQTIPVNLLVTVALIITKNFFKMSVSVKLLLLVSQSQQQQFILYFL